jgi:hypothetical protein
MTAWLRLAANSIIRSHSSNVVLFTLAAWPGDWSATWLPWPGHQATQLWKLTASCCVTGQVLDTEGTEQISLVELCRELRKLVWAVRECSLATTRRRPN